MSITLGATLSLPSPDVLGLLALVLTCALGLVGVVRGWLR